jgi:CheY-like chemotaxis protein
MMSHKKMPGVDAMTALQILRAAPETSRLKVIALTSFAMQGDRGKFMAAGFDDYLAKPISTRELPGLVQQWLSGEGLL